MALLKIEGFVGKFKEPGSAVPEGVASQVMPKVVAPIPSSKPGVVETDSRFRPEDSFRIKDSLRKIAQTEPVAKQQQQQQVTTKQDRITSRQAFNQQQVIHALENYLVTHKPEPIISIAIKSHKPLVEGENIVILADNQLQMDRLEAIKQQIQNVLMRSLENGFIVLSFQIFDDGNHQEEKKLFTSGEKFEHFLKLNPVVADLKVIFGLELE